MLIGHSQPRAQLASLLESGTFPHALLLHGPKGIGKATLARLLAERLICGPAVAEADMFGTVAATDPLAPNEASPQYHQLQAGSCPDFHVLERLLNPKTKKLFQNIKIDQVRELLGTLGRSADTARVVIIDAVDDLSDEASNILLKTLEEPRTGIYFILLCHALSRCLPTIRSRCRLLRMGPLSTAETVQVLERQGAENPLQLADLAQGCPGLVLGEGAPALAVQAAVADVESYFAGGALPSMSNAALVLDATLRVLAAKKGYTAAHAYSQLARTTAQAAEYNLPLAALAEATLVNLKGQLST